MVYVQVPAHFLTPLEHPDAGEPPYYTTDLIRVIMDYEMLVDKANERFEAIRTLNGT